MAALIRSGILTGTAADRESFRQLAGSYEVVHFANHALASLNNRYSALILAQAPATLKVVPSTRMRSQTWI